MSVRFVFDGFRETYAQLETLATDLANAAEPDVEAAGGQAVDTIRAAYHDRTGELRNKLSFTVARQGELVRAEVVNTSAYAGYYEFGTQARHTALGANRGTTPAHPVFIGTILRTRRALEGPLAVVMRAFGLTVNQRG